jgi:hypothetical protein
MLGGAGASALLHVTALVMALVVWPYVAPPIALPPDVLPVELLPPGETTNIAPEEKAPEPKPLPLPAPPQPDLQAFAEPPPPPPEPEAVPLEPDPLPLPPIQPVPAPQLAHAPPAVRPREKPKPVKQDEFDINRIAGLVDKIAKEPPKAEQRAQPAPAQSQRSLAGAGAQTALTMSEIDALRSQMEKCWNVPVGAPDPASLVLRVKVFLNEDGTVASPPQLLDQGRLGDPYFRAAADSAIRAVHICGPYQLPVEKYATWREITITFDPRQMSGY